MAHKRLLWKTIHLTYSDYCRHLESALGSQQKPKGKTVTLTKAGGGCEIETNAPLRWIKDWFSFASVRYDWKNGVVWDTMPLEERAAQWEAEENEP